MPIFEFGGDQRGADLWCRGCYTKISWCTRTPHIHTQAQNLSEQDPSITESSPSPSVHISVESSYVSMKSEEIKVELTLQEQRTYGRKPEMLLRLAEALQKNPNGLI